jgi:hypothetical protein
MKYSEVIEKVYKIDGAIIGCSTHTVTYSKLTIEQGTPYYTFSPNEWPVKKFGLEYQGQQYLSSSYKGIIDLLNDLQTDMALAYKFVDVSGKTVIRVATTTQNDSLDINSHLVKNGYTTFIYNSNLLTVLLPKFTHVYPDGVVPNEIQ